MIEQITVDLGQRSYPIFIDGDDFATSVAKLADILAKQVCIITNETVAPLYLAQLQHVMQHNIAEVVILPDGEQYKTLETLSSIFDHLLANHFDRGGMLCALGGGVVGDITGFAAACYQRGVKFIQIPTTLLAQVDASVGGKTAVNHPQGKNMIGAFHQPSAVLINVNTLQTLPKREYQAGLAEVVKYALIWDETFLTWLESKLSLINQKDTQTLMSLIRHCCEIKARIVSDDEQEKNIRAILNFGHTFGHAIEAVTQYQTWLHGEAVAMGMVMAADLSQQLGWLTEADVQRIQTLLQAFGLPVAFPLRLSKQAIFEAMSHDKKVLDQHIRLILLQGLGKAMVSADYPPQALHHCLEKYFLLS